MENKTSNEAIENLKKSILDNPEEILKRHSKSFRAWCVFRDFFAYWAGGLILAGWLINIINGLRFSFTTGQWWKELIVMCGVGVVTGAGYIIATAVKKHAAKLQWRHIKMSKYDQYELKEYTKNYFHTPNDTIDGGTSNV